MPDRTTKVTLTAVISQYVAGMEKAALSTRTLGTAAAKLAQQKQAFSDVGRVIFAVGALAAAGVALAIKEFADFDAKMAQIKTLSGATADEMDKLSDSALHLGQAIGFTATQVADAEIELVKAGVSVKDQLGGALKGALELAAAGQIDVAQATEIATVAMTQFALKGAQVPHVADLLAAGADKALGSVGDLGEALKSGGLVAAQFGVSLDETVGTLSAFANAGLLGETAGTDLRQLLLKLANPATDATAAMEKLGISIYDQSGKFVGLSGLAGQLKDKLSALSPEQRNTALATIFGSRAIAGANVLYKEGAAGIAKWTDEVNTSGFAAKQAAGKMDNLNGDVTKLKAAFQTSLIEAGSGANDILRLLTQSVTGLVSAVGDVPTPVLGVVLGLTGLVAVVGLVGGGALIAVPKIAAFKVGLETLDISGRKAALGLGIASGALAVVGVALGVFASILADQQAGIQSYEDGLDQITGKITTVSRETAKAALATGNWANVLIGGSADSPYQAAKKLGLGLDTLTDAALGSKGALDKVRDADLSNLSGDAYFNALAKGAKAAGLSTDDYSRAAKTVSLAIADQNGQLTEAQQRVKDKAQADADSVGPSNSAADAYKAAAAQVDTLRGNLTELVDTINKANNVGQDAISKNAAYQQGIADLTDYINKAHAGVDGYTLGIDQHTAAGAKNVAMLADLAKSNEDAAQAQFALDGDTNAYIATLTAGNKAVYDNAIALGANADQAKAIADQVAAIPDSKAVQILLDTAQAQQQLDRFHLALSNGVVIPIHFSDNLHGGFSSGGYTGDGSKTDVAGAVHKKEFVLDADATSKPSNRAAAQFMLGGGDIRYWNPATRYNAAAASQQQYAQAPGSTGGTSIPVNIKVTGETDPQVFAALAGQGVAARLRGVR